MEARSRKGPGKPSWCPVVARVRTQVHAAARLPDPVVAPKDDAVGGGVEVGLKQASPTSQETMPWAAPLSRAAKCRERATERRKEREEALCFPRDGCAPT